MKPFSSELGSRHIDPAVHHHIGVGENEPLHIGTFCRDHIDDPAVAVSVYQDPHSSTNLIALLIRTSI